VIESGQRTGLLGSAQPLRLLLGSMVHDVAFDVSRRRMSTWAAWEEVGRAVAARGNQ
jgi:hypothetical protein